MKKHVLLLFLSLFYLTMFSQVELDTVNTGSGPNTGDGDNGRVAFTKVNTAITHINKNLYLIDTVTSTQILTGDSIFIISDTNYLIDYITIDFNFVSAVYTSISSDTVKLYTQVNGVNTPILGLTNELFSETESFSFVTDAREIKQGDGVYWWSFPSGKYTTGNSFLIIRTYRTLEL